MTPETPLEARFREWETRRSCGTCTACCFIFDIEATGSPQYAWCRHCAIGRGCAVYAERPEECRNFYCLWRMGFGRDEDRPDRHGVVIDLQLEPDAHPVIRVWKPVQCQERKARSARRMQQEIWETLRTEGYAASIEVHGPPPEKTMRWDPVHREERHASSE
jgi:hypothetical protein